MKKLMIKMLSGVLAAVSLTITVASPAFAATSSAGTNIKESKTEAAVKMFAPITSEEALNKIAAMDIKDPVKKAKRDRAVEAERSCPHSGFIKRYLMEKGPNLALVLGIYFIPSPIMYEVIQCMEQEVKDGNCAYIFDGQYYESPAEDPNFTGDTSCYA